MTLDDPIRASVAHGLAKRAEPVNSGDRSGEDAPRMFRLAAMRQAPPAHMLRDMALRCLLIDDSPQFRESARTLLQREGVEMVLAASGEEAVRRLHEARPDVILLDIDLGPESGIDLAHTLNEGSLPGGARIILISTHAEKDFQDLIDSSPALGFLSKSSLSAEAIRQLLGRRD